MKRREEKRREEKRREEKRREEKRREEKRSLLKVVLGTVLMFFVVVCSSSVVYGLSGEYFFPENMWSRTVKDMLKIVNELNKEKVQDKSGVYSLENRLSILTELKKNNTDCFFSDMNLNQLDKEAIPQLLEMSRSVAYEENIYEENIDETKKNLKRFLNDLLPVREEIILLYKAVKTLNFADLKIKEESIRKMTRYLEDQFKNDQCRKLNEAINELFNTSSESNFCSKRSNVLSALNGLTSPRGIVKIFIAISLLAGTAVVGIVAYFLISKLLGTQVEKVILKNH